MAVGVAVAACAPPQPPPPPFVGLPGAAAARAFSGPSVAPTAGDAALSGLHGATTPEILALPTVRAARDAWLDCLIQRTAEAVVDGYAGDVGDLALRRCMRGLSGYSREIDRAQGLSTDGLVDPTRVAFLVDTMHAGKWLVCDLATRRVGRAVRGCEGFPPYPRPGEPQPL
jgi:hypothetical protein